MSTPARDAFLAAFARLEEVKNAEPFDELAYLVADAAFETARAAYIMSDEARTWIFGGEGGEGHPDMFVRRPDLTAVAESGDYGDFDASIAVRVTARCVETGEATSALVVIDPEAPPCVAGHSHEWRRVTERLSHRGGLSMEYVSRCDLCGATKTVTSPTQGEEDEHDHTVVRYTRERGRRS